MTKGAAAYLAAHFGVVHHQPNTEYGYSGTLFRRREVDPADTTGGFIFAIRGTEPSTFDDLRADILQIMFSGSAWHQRAGMLIQWDGLLSGAPGHEFDSSIRAALGSSQINVTGHSLGGHLGTWFANDRTSALGHVFAFNAPGMVYQDRTGFPAGRVSNLISDQYPDIISGLYTTYGTEDRFFIESGPGAGLMAGHSMNNLLNGIASSYLLSLIDPTLDGPAMHGILYTVTNAGTQTFEGFASVLQDIYGLPRVAGETEGDATIFGLIGRFEEGSLQAGQLIPLWELSPAVLASRAQAGSPEGVALRHALVNALPFAIVGGTAFDPAPWAANLFTAEYLEARSEYVQWLLRRNAEDAAIPDGLRGDLAYIDRASGTVLAGIAATPQELAARQQVMFGTSGADAGTALTGAAGNDRIFGDAGNDDLDGGAGNDYLEGGADNDVLRSGAGARDILVGGTGNDIYIVHRDSLSATIEDSDGLGSIAVSGEGELIYVLGNALQGVPGQAGLALDAMGNRYVRVGADLHVFVEHQTILVRDFTSGDLGITFPVAQAVAAPPGPAGVIPFAVTPTNPDGLNSIGRLSHVAGSPFYGSAYSLYYHTGGNSAALQREWIDLSRATLQGGFSSLAIAGGLGDSHIVGSPYRDSIIDDYNGAAYQGRFWATADIPGNDTLVGGAGNDVLETHGGDDRSFGGDGDDLLLDIPLRFSGDSLFSDIAWVQEAGHTNRDRLYGETGNDVIVASAGDAYLDGGIGNDELYGGAHDDTLAGGAGNDVLGGDSRVSGSLWTYAYPAGIDLTMTFAGRITEDVVAPGNDILDGGAGNDQLFGGGGNDRLFGGDNDDRLQGDTLFIPAGTRALQSNHGITPLALHGNDYLSGGAGTDTLYGGGGDDLLHGDAGNDTLYGNAGADILDGGAGVDYLVGDDAAGPQSDDELHGGTENDTLHGLGGNDRLYGDAGTDTLMGGDGDDVLEGGDDNDYSATGSAGLYGQAGNDILRGGAGQDRLQGGEGLDRLEADSGSDLLFGEGGDDTFVLYRGAGDVRITDEEGGNRIVFGPGIRAEQLRVSMAGGSVRVDFSPADSAFMGVATFAAIEEIEFQGGDSLEGAALRDLFVPPVLGADRMLLLGETVAFADIQLRRWNDDLLFVYGGDASEWVYTEDLGERNVLYSLKSGEAYGMNPETQVLALTNWYRANPSDYINHFMSWDGAAFGFVGEAEQTPATFTSKAGADVLVGTEGNDTYLYEGGDDVIVDDGGEDDRVLLGEGIGIADLAVTESAEGLRVAIEGTRPGSLLLTGWAQGRDQAVDGIELADGVLLDRQALDVLNTGNHSPRVTGLLSDRVVQRDESFSLVLPSTLFTDVDSGDSLTYAAWTQEGTPLPAWLSFNAGTRTFSGTPALEDAGTTSVVVTAADSAGLMSSITFDVIVSIPVEVLGTEGNDSIVRETAVQSQRLFGLGGNDLLWGGRSADLVDGGPGNDHVVGGGGDDVVIGGEGDDRVGGDSGYEDIGNDQLYGGDGNDVLNGGPGIDILFGGNGADTLYGTSNLVLGETIVFGGGSAMHGGAGDDTYYLRSPLDSIVELANEGMDTIATEHDYVLGDNLERLYFINGDAVTGIGNSLANELYGNGLDNLLRGLGGDDLLDGGEGSDRLEGGIGNDIYIVDAAGDVTTELAGEGLDTVHSSVTHTLASNIELLFLTGTSASNGTGNPLNNLLRGNAAVNRLAGGAGIDILEGGAGNDVLSDASGRTLLNGGEGADTLTGTSGNDLLIGGKGNDTLTTGAGADLILFNRGDGQDTIAASTTQDNTLSLGGGITYADLRFQRSGSNLLLLTGGGEQITFTGYYSSTANRSVDRLQIVTEATGDYLPGSTDALRNRRVQSFDFDRLVAAFDTARASNPSLTSWALNGSLRAQHWGGSDTAAMGGDLAYRYGLMGTFGDLSFNPAVGIMGASGFGAAAQHFQSLGTLQDNSARLM